MVNISFFFFPLQDGLRNRKANQSPTESTKSFTWKEVAQHNTSDSCWVSVNGKVYDITSELL